MGFDGGGEEVAGDYYGFAWSTSLSLVLPNGTNVPMFYTGNVLPGSSAYACNGFGSGAGPNTNESEPNASEALYQTSIVGTHTLLWNVTYGTSTDSSIANQTFCDISRLSYETFIFNKSISVVAPKPDFGAPLPENTKEERTFHPTGFIMSNSAGVVKSSVSFVFVGVLCAFLQILL
ncbi:hypothetical protein PHLGIDRAFT_18683 [Phlebiopsis gigantea 11061_1 CR5-6]|uniref:Uncharacterized protein n=1 Tax=Phlebiopsis gigantea (strain 11061_1 CR5-6) TaxID=745531 RepID=A0A0C3NVD2_PHLG1|nr:hypothetical protein PHLGIDRAFT_18683 [Phlebiopsis gigantea 11061_1 CR5-6]